MRTPQILALGGILLAPTIAWSQTVQGVVVEDGTRSPIAGVLVELLDPGKQRVASTHTDSAGAFLLTSDQPGDFFVRASHLGYTTITSDTLALGPGERLGVEIRMAQTALPLEPLVVTARGRARTSGFYDRVRSGFGRYITRADIERRGGTRVTDILRGMPGVSIVPAGPAGYAHGNLIAMRGGAAGRCTATVYVDGVQFRQGREGSVDDILHLEMLEGVEIYTTAAFAPSPFHSYNGCGVIAFWTRSDGVGKWSWKKLLAGVGGFLLLVLLAAR